MEQQQHRCCNSKFIFRPGYSSSCRNLQHHIYNYRRMRRNKNGAAIINGQPASILIIHHGNPHGMRRVDNDFGQFSIGRHLEQRFSQHSNHRCIERRYNGCSSRNVSNHLHGDQRQRLHQFGDLVRFGIGIAFGADTGNSNPGHRLRQRNLKSCGDINGQQHQLVHFGIRWNFTGHQRQRGKLCGNPCQCDDLLCRGSHHCVQFANIQLFRFHG